MAATDHVRKPDHAARRRHFMKEYGIERVWRDLRLNRIGAGTDEIMLDVIGRSYGL
jgi:alkylation response protein AidB-like acyl-CoA dehydrogenase